MALCSVLISVALLWSACKVILAKDNTTRITILCTNDTLGSLEPCGCGGRNTGGLPRRATFIKDVRAENPNLIVVESGDLAYAVNPSQPTAQLEAVADSFKAMGYTAVGVGPIDVRMGEDYFTILKKRGVPVIHADIKPHEGALPYLIKDIGGVKVGIVSFGAATPESSDDLNLLKKRYAAYKEARQASDILILLDQGKVATDEWLENSSRLYGSPDVVVGGPSRACMLEAKTIGQTLIVPSSTLGSFVGRVDIDIDGNNKKMIYTRISISPEISIDRDVNQIVKDYVNSQNPLVGDEHNYISDREEPYYPYRSCIPCHKAEYEQWKTTHHAKAVSTLVEKKKLIHDCLPCHSYMYRQKKKVTISSDKIGGVECAVCHSDILPHGSDYKKKNNLEAIRSKCKTCHTPERSPKFDVDDALKYVHH
jgi:2',3'-cyclic-nucleotide 2'-phosphodiesterase (5'-nucleotidase family)